MITPKRIIAATGITISGPVLGEPVSGVPGIPAFTARR